MPLYYHVHRSPRPSKIEKKINPTKALFLSKKNSFWYTFEKKIGKEEFGGYIIYEICIPRSNFTISFAPKTNNKILKINKKNVKEYVNLKNKYKGNINFIDELKSRGLIGYDATSQNIHKYAQKMTRFHTSELVIFDFTNYKPTLNIVEKHNTPKSHKK